MSLTMREWIFTESAGRYNIDLGDSNVDLVPLSAICNMEKLSELLLSYGDDTGLPALREAVALNYVNAKSENVLICHGAQEAFTLLIRSLDIKAGSEALVLGSGWQQHKLFPAEIGLVVKELPFETHSDADRLTAVADAMTSNTRAIIVASPDNPTGHTMSRKLLIALAEAADVYGALLIVDEEYVVDYSKSVACLDDSIAIISGLSKIHGVPGLRVGWCLADPDRIKRCVQRKHLTTISNSVLCETIALAVVNNNEWFLSRAKSLCRNGASTLRKWAEHVGSVNVVCASDDLPFSWIKLADDMDSLVVARRALEKGVLVIPGEVFDRSGYLRVTVGRNLDTLTAGLSVIERVLSGG